MLVIKFVIPLVVHEHYDYGLIINKDKDLLLSEYFNLLFLNVWLMSWYFPTTHRFVTLLKISLHNIFTAVF